MPVVKRRRRSWEEHVTSRSGPCYSLDDLDLVCCRGGRRNGPRSRRVHRERCASLPEWFPAVTASVVEEDGSEQWLEGEAGERVSCELPVSGGFECGSVRDNDIMADQSQKPLCSLAPSTAVCADKQDGDESKDSPHPLHILAKIPMASETPVDAPLGPTNDSKTLPCVDDLGEAEEANSNCPTAQLPSSNLPNLNSGLSRLPDVLLDPKTTPNISQTTVAAAQQVEGSNSTATLECTATLTAGENATALLSRHPSGFEGSVLKEDTPDHTPSLEPDTVDSVAEREPETICQGHMTGETEYCEKPGKAKTDLACRLDADISGMDTAPEAQAPEGLVLAGAAHQVMSSPTPAAQHSSRAQSTASLPSSTRPADLECLQTDCEALSAEPCETATRDDDDDAHPEPLASLECSVSMGVSQERRHEGGSGGSKLDTILEVSLSEVGDETGGAEKPGWVDNDEEEAATEMPCQNPQESEESPGTTNRCGGVELPSPNDTSLDGGACALQSAEGRSAPCSEQLELGEAGDASSMMAAAQEEGGATGRCDPHVPTSAVATEEQEHVTEETTVKLRRRKMLAVVTEKDKAEIEAKEACNWLRAAGFPQYAQLYEDGQFPIEISSVTRDHDFLDGDAIEALCRRLHTLNKCALMRLDVSPQRKRSDDSDEDEPCAISGRWTFQRDSKRWSRLDELDVFVLPGGAGEPSFPSEERLRKGMSTESVLTDLSEQPEVGSLHSGGSVAGDRRDGTSERGGRLPSAAPSSPGVGGSMMTASGGATRASSVASVCSSATSGANEDSLSDGLPSPLELRSFSFDVKLPGEEQGSGGGVGKSSGSTRSRAKSFLKRMESLRLRGGTLTRRKKPRSKLEISGPVGIQEGLDEEKLRRLNCVDIHPAQNDNLENQNGDNSSSGGVSGGTHGRHRSVSYFTQTSSGSAGSSQSEGGSSGSAVSTPSPVTRARSHSTAAAGSGYKRGGMYLEGFDPLSLLVQASQERRTQNDNHNLNTIHNTNQNLDLNKNRSAADGVVAQNRRNSKRSSSASAKYEVGAEDEAEAEEEEEDAEGVIFFYLPEGHKPGTFPKALADGGQQRRRRMVEAVSTIRRRPRRGSATSLDSRLSVYDNVPASLARSIGCEEDEDEADLERAGEAKLEDVLKDVSGLQRLVNAWTEAVTTGEEEEEEEEEEDEEEEEEDGDSDSALDSASPCPSSPLQNRLEEENASDQDSTGNPHRERERRDSGVGASLTRANRPQKLRWPSFQSSHRPSLSSSLLQIDCQSVLQMLIMQKVSLLRLTALLEKHTPTNKHGFSWAVPKFMKRMKVRDYKDRSVFGVPLHVNVQRTGQPLPQSIQQAMRYLRSHCLDQVGLFRKSGVKSRIQALRQMNESCGADGVGVNYEGQSAYDVADMLKQYFRDLPEPLFTTKLADTFLQIYQYMPKEQRLQAVSAAVLLLPDEARESLQTLLCFLSDVTASVADNQMTCTNLAVCLAPSLFHLNTLRRDSSSPRVMNRKQNLGKPDQRDLNENLAATHGLAHMIQECHKLFQIPEEMSRCRNSYMEQYLSPVKMEELLERCGPHGYCGHLKEGLDALLKEAKDKFRGYDSVSTPEPAELAYKKMHDGSRLRLWKASVEVPASPEEVLSRVLREQQRWDEDLLEGRVVETLEEHAEVYQYVRNSMAPHPPRDHVVLRTWFTDLPKAACALLSESVDHDRAAVMGVRANVLTSRYYMEPCGQNKTRLTHISRVDCRGRFPEWYSKLYGHQCAAEVVRIRDSFTSPMDK
ncbi:rho GTPase-activating protein 7 isoform X2 [Engraulis encrasicolus]|uniref:rho GTPase-activating protein 7 isoform X2 n=1 Tax=Engraulis encrasicolus TaxID=184585 RepID=UPI002FCF8DA1